MATGRLSSAGRRKRQTFVMPWLRLLSAAEVAEEVAERAEVAEEVVVEVVERAGGAPLPWT